MQHKITFQQSIEESLARLRIALLHTKYLVHIHGPNTEKSWLCIFSKFVDKMKRNSYIKYNEKMLYNSRDEIKVLLNSIDSSKFNDGEKNQSLIKMILKLNQLDIFLNEAL